MMNKGHNTERGQALVLLVFGFVVLLGFTALAVDGSMLYSDRRYAQNAADAASLAGGGQAALSLENARVNSANWLCNSSRDSTARLWAYLKARDRALDNDFVIDNNPSNDGITDDGHVSIECEGTSGKYIDVIVEITTETKTAFAHFVYRGPMVNTVRAVTRVYPRQPVAEGMAIVALNPNACSGQSNGATFLGTGNVTIFGSGVFTNGCLRGNGGPTVDAEGAIQYVVNQIDVGGASAFSPAPNQVGQRLTADDFSIPLPDCSDPAATNWTRRDFEDLTTSGTTPSLSPGLHCVNPDNQDKVTLNGGSITGYGVTIVLNNVELTINGNVEVHLHAPPQGSDPYPAYEGLLFYSNVDPCNTSSSLGDIILNGTGLSTFTGTIYAPCNNVDATGVADMTAFSSQIIGWNVEVGGTADTTIHFDPSENYTRPTWIDLYR